MNKSKNGVKKRSVVWLLLLVFLTAAATTVYAILPEISLNSPTSFPVDI